MSVVALHPEELLEREARGELSPAEAERLRLHLKHCAVCRLERTLRADFQRGEDPLTSDLDVQALLSSVLAPAAEPRSSSRASSRVWRERERPARASAMQRTRTVLLIAAALFVAGASVAAGWNGIPRIEAGSGEVLWKVFRSAKRAPEESAVASASRSTPAVVGLPDPGVSSGSAPPETVRSVSVAPSSALSSAFSRTGIGASGLTASTAPVANAAALFAQANAVRRTGDHARAVELYRALVDRYPRSAEAHETQAALGRLLLRDGNAGSALRCFDEYLNASGPLDEDVRVDRAQALGRLHRAGDEADAWSSLLRTYPSSVHAERARARLRELGERP